MNLFKSVDLSHETLDNKSYKEQFTILRKFLISKYHIDYMLSFMVDASGTMKELEGNTTVDPLISRDIGDRPQSLFNNNVLMDSKRKGIKARFKIPLRIDSIDFFIIMEAKRVNAIIGKEDSIYQDIITFIKSVSKSPLC